MTHRILNRTAQVTSNTPNAATAYNFTGSAVSLLAFSFVSRSMTTGDTIGYYADNGAGQYERGLGTWDNAALTLTRTTIRESSTGSAIVWTAAPTVWSDGRQDEDVVVSGGGSVITTTEINLGTKPTTNGSFTISGTGMTPGKPVAITQAAESYTGKGTFRDEIEMDQLTAAGYVENATTIRCHWGSNTLVAGNFKFNHFVGA